MKLPVEFWLVQRPSPACELGDICFRCDFKQFAKQVRGGLDEDEIIGAFTDEAEATAVARGLLEGKRGAERISDEDR